MGVITIRVQITLDIIMVVLMCAICSRGGHLSVLPRRLHGFCRHICFPPLRSRATSPDLDGSCAVEELCNEIKSSVEVEKNRGLVKD